MNSTSHFVFAVLLSCLSSATSADAFTYICEVSHLYSLGKNGVLETSPESELERLMKKNSFSISRETGVLIGNSASLDTSLAKSTRVINRGSKENSFEAVADFGGFESGTHPYQFIKVEEFQKGTVKPFVVMGEVGIVTGVCK